MGNRDPRVDAYIARQADFAKPILTYLRDVIHEGCPECVETLKWSTPAIEYRGILCGFAGFKQHVQFGFWKHELLVGPRQAGGGMGFGKITSIDDLPSKRELLALTRKAMELNEKGVKVARIKNSPKKPIPVPADLKAALAKNKKAKTTFDEFSPSNKREYLEWITEAKGEDTRKRRVAQAIEWMAEGKPRNWKYM